MDNKKGEEKSIFNTKDDENELLIELNNSEKIESNTIQDKVAQFVSKLRTSAINLNESINLIKNAIEAADTISTSKFIKRIKNMKMQHKKYIEEIAAFKNNQELSPEISENIQEELDKNYNLINDTDTLLEIAEEALNNPEKYKDKFKNKMEDFSVMINKREEKKVTDYQEKNKEPQNKEPQKKDTEKKEIKEKEIIKITQSSTDEPVTVNIDFIPQERKKESEIDIEIETPIKGNVSMNRSLLLNDSLKINKNIDANKNKTQDISKKPTNHQFGLPISRTNYQEQIPKKVEKKPKEEVIKEVDAYDFMMNKSGSNAKKLVEFHIEDIEKD